MLLTPPCQTCVHQALQQSEAAPAFASCFAPSPFLGEGGGTGACSGPTADFEKRWPVSRRACTHAYSSLGDGASRVSACCCWHKPIA